MKQQETNLINYKSKYFSIENCMSSIWTDFSLNWIQFGAEILTVTIDSIWKFSEAQIFFSWSFQWPSAGVFLLPQMNQSIWKNIKKTLKRQKLFSFQDLNKFANFVHENVVQLSLFLVTLNENKLNYFRRFSSLFENFVRFVFCPISFVQFGHDNGP